MIHPFKYQGSQKHELLKHVHRSDFTSNLGLYIPFDGNNITKDYSGNNNNATLNGAFSTRSPLGRCIGTDGIDDDATVADSATYRNIFSGGGVFFVEFSLNAISADGGILRKGSAVQVRLINNSGNNCSIRFIHNHATTTGRWDFTNRVISKNGKYRFAISYDNSNNANDPIFYLNGQEYSISNGGLTQDLGPVGTASADSGSSMTLGKNNTTFTNAFYKNLIIWNESKTSKFLKKFTELT